LLLRAYAGLAAALRYEAETPRALRELMILRTAQLTSSDYEWAHHRAMAAANGVAEDKVRALASWSESPLFGEQERAALRCVEEVHVIGVTDAGFAALEEHAGPSGAVELVLLAALYEAVARLIQAFGLAVEPAYERYLGLPDASGGVAGRAPDDRRGEAAT
jgi:alkylhydroperoxidase family enzyme